MMRPKDIGTLAETAVVKYLIPNGFPDAERRALAGQYDKGDLLGTPGVCWEVKSGQAAERASDGQVQKWMAETELERVNSGSEIGVLVMKRSGIGAGRAGEWWAVLPLTVFGELAGFRNAVTDSTQPVRLHLSTAVRLLRIGGYGTAFPEDDLTA